MTSFVDVLIIGAGPAGLMAAAWLTRCGIKTRIIDKRDEKVHGQADGLQSRTFEIFDSFGFGQQAWREANHMLEMCFWNPDEDGKLRRSNVLVDTIPGISRFQHATLNQGRIEEFFYSSLKEHGDVEVERSTMPESLELDEVESEKGDAHPITVRVRRHSGEKAAGSINGAKIPNGLYRSNLTADDNVQLLKEKQSAGMQETIKAKYVIGCDGAHSWVRKQVGFEMQGEQTDYIWGVFDIIPITDLPDIRKRCAVSSANSGSLMIIPRENKLTRIYVQLEERSQEDRTSGLSVTPETILKRAQQILAPYRLEYKYCDWYTAYRIGQRVASKFSYKDRVFLAGDAVHTHSPKAGQGMNISMHDTYNLGWKIASVVNEVSKPSILSTYELERRQVALELIEFDHKFSRLFSGRPAKDAGDIKGINMDDFRSAYEKSNLFTCGLSVEYGQSIITAKDNTSSVKLKNSTSTPQDLARLIKVGMRMPSYQVLNQADARPYQFQEVLKSNGCWRIVIFAGDISNSLQMERLQRLCNKLSSILHRFTPPSKPIHSRIEVLAIHSAPRLGVEFFDFPEILRPFSEDLGWDYDKIFADGPSYHEGHGHAYQNYGVDGQAGCVVVIRPDQHVSLVGGMEDFDAVDAFFSAFMVPCCK